MNITLILNIATDVISGNWLRAGARLTGSIKGATKQASEEIEKAVSEVVASGGNFGGKWTEGIHATVIEGNGFNSQIQVTSDIPFFSVFNNGVTIKGNPFLWLPLSFGEAAGQRVSSYSGRLFMVNRRTGGPPLLLSIESKQPLFVGLSSVTIKKKWDMASVIQNVMRGFAGMIES